MKAFNRHAGIRIFCAVVAMDAVLVALARFGPYSDYFAGAFWGLNLPSFPLLYLLFSLISLLPGSSSSLWSILFSLGEVWQVVLSALFWAAVAGYCVHHGKTGQPSKG